MGGTAAAEGEERQHASTHNSPTNSAAVTPLDRHQRHTSPCATQRNPAPYKLTNQSVSKPGMYTRALMALM